MKKLSVALGLVAMTVAVWIVSGHAQGQSRNPFWDRSDNGEIVHVLPPEAAIHSPHDTQPTFATPSRSTAVYPASYGGSALLTNHGGPQIGGAGFWAVYWNAQASDARDTSLGYGTIKEQIDAFVTNFSDGANWDNSATDDYTIVQQYGSQTSIAAGLTNWGYYPDQQPSSKSIKDSTIRNYLASLFNAGKLPVSNSIVYGVYLPPGMKVTLQGGTSCSSFCGYHGNFNYAGVDIKYASFPYLNCTACQLSGLSVADMLTIVTSHEIREAVTDPDLNAWYDASGNEADDKCAWHNLYQITGNGAGGFWVQPEFSNGGTVNRSGFSATYPGPGCVVPNR